ncbi:MAG: hypothetical protein WB543_18985 [Candidatus Acidiferrum sp.]
MTYRAIVLISALCASVSSLVAQQTNAPATHTLKATPRTVAWGYYDAKAAPALHVGPELGGLYPAKRVIL